jgi:Pvc16 N-terminal domain
VDVLDRLNFSIENFLREETPLPASSIDISFETPDKDWSARLVRPTVNLFLHEIRRSTARSVTGTFTKVGNGEHRREALAPFVRLRFAISVWTTDASDAHQLLGQLLSLVATAGSLPTAYLEPPLNVLGNRVEMALVGEEIRSANDIWSGLGVAPRAAIDLAVVLPVAPPASRIVPAPPTEVGLRSNDLNEPSRTSTATGSLAGVGAGGEGRRSRRSRVEEV